MYNNSLVVVELLCWRQQQSAAARRRISFSSLRVENDAARWLAAGRWLVLHPAGGLSEPGWVLSQCSSRWSRYLPLLLTHTHTRARAHTHTLIYTHSRSWVRAASVCTTGFCNLQLTSPERTNRGTWRPNNACTLHYAVSQVTTTFALFQEVTGEV